MIRQFLKITFRQFRSQPVINALSLFGISIGLAGVIVLAIIVRAEFSFDRFHSEPDKIFRLTTVFQIDGRETRFAINDAFLDQVMVSDVPNVKSSTAFQPTGSLALRVGEKTFVESNGFLVDADFLSVFDFKTITGKKSLTEPNEIGITESFALKLFGTMDVLDQVVEFDWANIGGVSYLEADSPVQFGKSRRLDKGGVTSDYSQICSEGNAPFNSSI